MIVLRRGDRRVVVIEIGEGMFRLFVRSVGRIRLFRLSLYKESLFCVGNVLGNEFV
jgi:hypothetical protein